MDRKMEPIEVPESAHSKLARQQKIMYSLLEDLNDSKKALAEKAEELERSNSDLDQYAAVVSHDLKEPLNTVSNFLQLYKDRYKGRLDGEADEYIQFACDGAARMRTMIKDLLEYSRVTKKSTPFSPTDLNEVLNSALDNLKASIEGNGAKIIADALPTAMADASQMLQLFQNLIANAIKFRSNDPPRVEIHCRKSEGEWRFCVRDDGIGFEQRYAERIFLIFQRLHARSAYPGSGIGLAVAKKIVERHGGRIWAESQVGKGSSFYFTLPEIEGEMR
jgi:light-regulated signal transduction histidine kinase (bacteriophytochrome)